MGETVVRVTEHPFVGDVAEVPLPAAPLVKVLAQVRYPRPAGFSAAESIEPAQRALAGRYPINREGQSRNLVITPEGVTEQPGGGSVWTLQDLTAAWQVTLAEQFVAIETSSYESRTDFCNRLEELLSVVAKTLRPPIYDRLGGLFRRSFTMS